MPGSQHDPTVDTTGGDAVSPLPAVPTPHRPPSTGRARLPRGLTALIALTSLTAVRTADPSTPRARLPRGLGTLAVVLAVAAVTGVLIAPDPARPASAADPAPTGAAGALLRRSGFGGPVGGSLATDHAEIAALRARMTTGFPDPAGRPVAAAAVLLLWAGDLGDHRYALALVPRAAGGWAPAILTGPAGAPARALTPTWHQESGETGYPRSPVATFVRPPSGPRADAAVFVVSPYAIGVEIASARRFRPGGGSITTWRPLYRQGGAVWAGAVTAGEQFLADYRISPASPDRPAARAASVGGPDLAAAVVDRAAGSAANTGNGRQALLCAADAARATGASVDDRPVLASATTWGARDTLAVALLRSPEQAWLWGLCDVRLDRSATEVAADTLAGDGVARERWAGPGAVMAVMETGTGRYAVFAPAGAERVRVRGVAASTTQVHDRLALLRSGPGGRVTLEAVARDGRVLARQTLGPAGSSTR